VKEGHEVRLSHEQLSLSPNAAIDTGGNASPHLVADTNGTWLAAWLSTDSLGGALPPALRVFVARSTNGGLTWSFPQPIGAGTPGGAGYQSEPKLASNGDGTWLIAMRAPASGPRCRRPTTTAARGAHRRYGRSIRHCASVPQLRRYRAGATSSSAFALRRARYAA
jgi:hypothetical protein